MAAHDASYMKQGDTLNLEALVGECSSELPTKPTAFGSSGFVNTASATYVTLASWTATLEADEVALVLFSTGLSGDGAVGTQAFLQLRANGVQIGSQAFGFFYSTVDNDFGEESTLVLTGYCENLSGTITFDVQWKRNAGSALVISAWRHAEVYQFKKR